MQAADDMTARTAHNATGCLRITLDTNGRVTDIHLSTSWRDRIGAEGLEQELVRTIQQAQVDAQRASSESTTTDPTAGNTQGAIRPALDALPSSERRSALHRIALLTHRALEEAETRAAQLNQLEGMAHEGADLRRYVTVTLSGEGWLRSIVFDQKWLRSASTERLVENLREAVTAAYAEADAGVAEVDDMPATVQLNKIAADPSALAQWLAEER